MLALNPCLPHAHPVGDEDFSDAYPEHAGASDLEVNSTEPPATAVLRWPHVHTVRLSKPAARHWSFQTIPAIGVVTRKGL